MDKDKPTWLPFVDKVNYTYNQNQDELAGGVAQREREGMLSRRGLSTNPKPQQNKDGNSGCYWMSDGGLSDSKLTTCTNLIHQFLYPYTSLQFLSLASFSLWLTHVVFLLYPRSQVLALAFWPCSHHTYSNCTFPQRPQLNSSTFPLLFWIS